MGSECQHQEMNHWQSEQLTDMLVRYLLDINGQILVFENVPARVNQETSEQFFSPATVRKIQQVAMSSQSPARTIQVAVFEFAA
jgi:hypothetical protein